MKYNHLILMPIQCIESPAVGCTMLVKYHNGMNAVQSWYSTLQPEASIRLNNAPLARNGLVVAESRHLHMLKGPHIQCAGLCLCNALQEGRRNPVLQVSLSSA